MKDKYDVLVTDSRYKHSLAIVRALGKSGLRVATCSEGFSPTKFSKYSKKAYSYSASNFKDKLLKFLEDNEVGLVLPVGYFSNIECSKIKKKIRKYSNIVINDYSMVSIVSDKQKIISLLDSAGIVYPKTIKINTISDLGKVGGGKHVVKSAEEGVGEKVIYVNSKQEMFSVISDRLKLGPQIIQRYISGKGRGFFAFCKNGDVLQSFQHERIRQYPESGGVSSCSKSINDKKLNKISIDFLKKIKWTGPVMLEFIYDPKEKQYYFIEMNAKFWGSYDLSTFCGLNFSRIPYDIINGGNIREVKYEVGKRFQWILPEDTLRIKTCKNKWAAFLFWKKDLFNKETGKDIQYIFNDPIPTLLRITSTIWSVLFEK